MPVALLFTGVKPKDPGSKDRRDEKQGAGRRRNIYELRVTAPSAVLTTEHTIVRLAAGLWDGTICLSAISFSQGGE
jgi:hypothetical protein